MKQNDRELVAKGMIVCAIIFGAANFLLTPQLAQLQDRLETRDSLAEQARLSIDPVSLTARQNEIESRIASLSDRNQRSMASDVLYERIWNVGEATGVSMQRVTPKTDLADERTKVDRLVFQLALDGTLEQILDFLDGLESVDAFHRTMSVRLSAAKNADRANAMLAASIDIEFFRFETPSEMTSEEKTDERN
ncbi:MAG: hypothetical protein ACF8PN_14475 [Phycisphaerales bacterium]